jgi:hypothetical protein
MLDASTILLRDQARSSPIMGRKMLKVKPLVLAWTKRLMKAAATMYQP